MYTYYYYVIYYCVHQLLGTHLLPTTLHPTLHPTNYLLLLTERAQSDAPMAIPTPMSITYAYYLVKYSVHTYYPLPFISLHPIAFRLPTSY